MNCDWHHVYYNIIETVQQHIKHDFGPNFILYIKSDFGCANCANREE